MDIIFTNTVYSFISLWMSTCDKQVFLALLGRSFSIINITCVHTYNNDRSHAERNLVMGSICRIGCQKLDRIYGRTPYLIFTQQCMLILSHLLEFFESISTVSGSMGECASVREYIIVVVYIDYGGAIWRVLTLCRISHSILQLKWVANFLLFSISIIIVYFTHFIIIIKFECCSSWFYS